MPIDWTTFTFAEWDSFTFAHWDTFRFDPVFPEGGDMKPPGLELELGLGI